MHTYTHKQTLLPLILFQGSSIWVPYYIKLLPLTFLRSCFKPVLSWRLSVIPSVNQIQFQTPWLGIEDTLPTKVLFF